MTAESLAFQPWFISTISGKTWTRTLKKFPLLKIQEYNAKCVVGEKANLKIYLHCCSNNKPTPSNKNRGKTKRSVSNGEVRTKHWPCRKI